MSALALWNPPARSCVKQRAPQAARGARAAAPPPSASSNSSGSSGGAASGGDHRPPKFVGAFLKRAAVGALDSIIPDPSKQRQAGSEGGPDGGSKGGNGEGGKAHRHWSQDEIEYLRG